MSTDRVPLEASRPRTEAGLSDRTDPPLNQTVEVTILVRRKPSAGTQQRMEQILRGEAPPIARAEAEEALGADAGEVKQVTDFAAAYGLTVTESSPAKRSVKVSGTVVQMETAFGVKLYSCGGPLCYDGPLTIPASLDGIVEGVLGLDQRPVARR